MLRQRSRSMGNSLPRRLRLFPRSRTDLFRAARRESPAAPPSGDYRHRPPAATAAVPTVFHHDPISPSRWASPEALTTRFASPHHRRRHRRDRDGRDRELFEAACARGPPWSLRGQHPQLADRRRQRRTEAPDERDCRRGRHGKHSNPRGKLSPGHTLHRHSRHQRSRQQWMCRSTSIRP